MQEESLRPSLPVDWLAGAVAWRQDINTVDPRLMGGAEEWVWEEDVRAVREGWGAVRTWKWDPVT